MITKMPGEPTSSGQVWRSALCGRQHETRLTLSLELRAFAARMEEVDEAKWRDYEEEVREKARMLGRPVPVRAVGPLARPRGSACR